MQLYLYGQNKKISAYKNEVFYGKNVFSVYYQVIGKFLYYSKMGVRKKICAYKKHYFYGRNVSYE